MDSIGYSWTVQLNLYSMHREKVPIPLCEKLKNTVDDLIKKKIIAMVVSPTEWVSSMLVVHKKNNILRICIHPKDLNQEI